MTFFLPNKNGFQSVVKCLIFAGILVFSNHVCAQKHALDNKKIDSLERILNTPSLPEDDFYWTCERLYIAYGYEEPAKALEYVWKAVRLAEKRKNYYQLGIFYYSAGNSYFTLGKPDSAIYFYEQALGMEEKAKKKGLTEDEDFEFLNMQIQMALGAFHQEAGRYDLALFHSIEALKLVEEMGIPDIEASLLCNIALNYQSMSNLQQAEKYLLKSLKIRRELNNPLALAGCLLDFSSITDDVQEALKYAEEAEQILAALSEVSPFFWIDLTNKLTEIWLRIPNYHKALKYALRSVEYAEEIQVPYKKMMAYSNLSSCYLWLKRYKEAEETAFRALEVDSSTMHGRSRLYQLISLSNIWMKNSAKAEVYFRKALDAQNEYALKNYQTSLAEMEVKFETEKKENEIARQQNIIARHNLERRLWAGGLALSVIIIALSWYLLRMRKRRNQMLVEINATKDKFFNIISHDLRNPAIAQRDAIQQLAQNSDLWNKGELGNYCNNLLKSANEEVELLHGLLSWAQIQTGRINYNPITFDLPAHLRNDISLLRNMAASKKITLIDNMPTHAQVTGDNNMILTVVRNFLTNAIKFTPGGGTVTLEITPTSHPKPQTSHRISVSDTGIGMTEEQIRKLCGRDAGKDVMNRVSTKGTIGEQGSGLGLIVCQELLQKHGSCLHIESEPGKGCIFWFEI